MTIGSAVIVSGSDAGFLTITCSDDSAPNNQISCFSPVDGNSWNTPVLSLIEFLLQCGLMEQRIDLPNNLFSRISAYYLIGVWRFVPG